MGVVPRQVVPLGPTFEATAAGEGTNQPQPKPWARGGFTITTQDILLGGHLVRANGA